MAKDCTGGSAKFILKEDNIQHGGDESRSVKLHPAPPLILLLPTLMTAELLL